MPWTFWLMCGAFFSVLSVALGAFGAHALKTRVDSYYLEIFETAVKYQMYHGLALLALPFVATRFDGSVAQSFRGINDPWDCCFFR